MRQSLIFAVLSFVLTACFPNAELEAAHTALDVVHDVTAPSYKVFESACSTAQWAVTRNGSLTVARKKARVAKIRAKCHPVYELFEAVIEKQLEARALIDAGESVVEVLSMVADVRRMLAEAQRRASDFSPESVGGSP